MSSLTSQRLDKWLWFARFAKTRSQASRLVEAGKIRVNRAKVMKPASQVKAGDVITAIINRQAKVVKILDPGKRRGPASEAQTLYEDKSPKPEKTTKEKKAKQEPMPIADAPKRDPGTGRPTKRDRRKMDRFRERAENRRSRRRSEDS